MKLTEFLIKKVIGSCAPDNPESRKKYSYLSGFAGIFCNVLLCVVKFIIGFITNSVSITADAANNLSDASSNIVTIIGAKIAGKPVDEDHPFGHGRAEYISALIVSFFIFIMGFELGKSSFEKIIHPETLKFNTIAFIVLLLAIPVKLWMAYLNNKLYKITQNENMKAVRQDSLNDCIATSATIAALLISNFTSFKRADGIIGLVVAVLIIFAGIGIVKDIISKLLGQTPDKELVNQIEELMMSEEKIIGVHDLIVHDYGPGRIIASAHAEVPADCDILQIHDVIDNVEKKISRELNIVICIHMDPIVVNDETVEKYKQMISKIIVEYDNSFSFHDFRMVKGPTHTNLIFDLVIPHKYPKKPNEILKDIRKIVSDQDSSIFIVATIEHSYT